MTLNELEKLVREGNTPAYADAAQKMGGISITDFNAAVVKAERERLIDLGVIAKPMGGITKSTWASMSIEERKAFAEAGGQVTDDQEHIIPPEQEIITGHKGASMTFGEFQKMSPRDRMDFSIGAGRFV